MRKIFQFVEQIQGRTSIRGNPVCALCEVNGVTTKVTPFAYSLSYEHRPKREIAFSFLHFDLTGKAYNRNSDITPLMSFISHASSGSVQTSIHSAPVISCKRSGAMTTAEAGLPAAG